MYQHSSLIYCLLESCLTLQSFMSCLLKRVVSFKTFLLRPVQQRDIDWLDSIDLLGVDIVSLQDAKGNKGISSSTLSCHVSNKVVDVELFHAHLGHCSVSKLKHVDSCRTCCPNYLYCDTCLLYKFHKLPFSRSESIASQPFELVHMDLWGSKCF